MLERSYVPCFNNFQSLINVFYSADNQWANSNSQAFIKHVIREPKWDRLPKCRTNRKHLIDSTPRWSGMVRMQNREFKMVGPKTTLHQST